jgi:hypothetical protein
MIKDSERETVGDLHFVTTETGKCIDLKGGRRIKHCLRTLRKKKEIKKLQINPMSESLSSQVG